MPQPPRELVLEARIDVPKVRPQGVMCKFALLQIPVPRPPRSVVERIAALVATLVTADERFEDLMALLKGHRLAREAHDRHEIKCQIDVEVARLFNLSGSELDRVLSRYDKVPEGTKRRVRELFSGEASVTAQRKALASEARRLIEAHRDEYPRLRPGEVLLDVHFVNPSSVFF
jgi:hypothetical protein